MSLKVNVSQLQKNLPELLDRAVQTNDPCLIERNGQPYAVLVSISEWRRHTIGQRLDTRGPAFRVTRDQQQRTEALLAKQQTGQLTRAEQRALKELLQTSEAVMLRRAEAMEEA
jgi:prevent-host-death family protein